MPVRSLRVKKCPSQLHQFVQAATPSVWPLWAQIINVKSYPPAMLCALMNSPG